MSKWTILQKTRDAWHLLSLCAKWLVLAIKITIITIILTESTAQSQALRHKRHTNVSTTNHSSGSWRRTDWSVETLEPQRCNRRLEASSRREVMGPWTRQWWRWRELTGRWEQRPPGRCLLQLKVEFRFWWPGESQLREERRCEMMKFPLRAFVFTALIDGHPGKDMWHMRLLIMAAYGFPCTAGDSFYFEVTYTSLWNAPDPHELPFPPCSANPLHCPDNQSRVGALPTTTFKTYSPWIHTHHEPFKKDTQKNMISLVYGI